MFLTKRTFSHSKTNFQLLVHLCQHRFLWSMQNTHPVARVCHHLMGKSLSLVKCYLNPSPFSSLFTIFLSFPHIRTCQESNQVFYFVWKVTQVSLFDNYWLLPSTLIKQL